MKPWLIIPAKPFTAAKSRLATILSPTERARLGAFLLERTLRVAQEAEAFDEIMVISRDPVALQLASGLGARALAETGVELNEAVTQACRDAQENGATCVLVLPADLPRLTAADLHLLCAAADAPETVVITPSRDGGTNALLLSLPVPFAFAYGRDSFQHHARRATRSALDVRVVETDNLRFDLDAPADLSELANDGPVALRELLATLAPSGKSGEDNPLRVSPHGA
ncbi:MAG: 2-phospho-L-lactate guanylyltransferase [Caldilinea sp.]|nr:2-phospho-L-lactate guanylyltransferase [Caldilinea sp.]MCB0065884.1 2-phospho-L-lactate guanylyltransferase [Caldilineaceae bacterium]MCB0040261.1 2-phospho-L-lactate guanylyltransferase [Caldilinea sp.]MCB9115101.1 2-phospho-L-lactate guanylyltransferase [Caldilineaceae bacterium]MCB9119176.1 2-phospho-L-lactate guanylyltransferase [Caldilineaceae bacterium]